MAGRDSKKKLSNKRRAEGFEGNVSKRIKIEEPVVQKTTNTSKVFFKKNKKIVYLFKVYQLL